MALLFHDLLTYFEGSRIEVLKVPQEAAVEEVLLLSDSRSRLVLG